MTFWIANLFYFLAGGHDHGSIPLKSSAKVVKPWITGATQQHYMTFFGVAIGALLLCWLFFSLSFDPEDTSFKRKKGTWTSIVLFLGAFFVTTGIFVFYIDQTYSHVVAVFHGLGIGCFVGGTLLGTLDFGQMFSGKSFVFNALSIFIVAAIVVLIFVANYFSIRHSKKLDFTSNQRESLDPATIKVLKGLKKNVEVFVFLEESQQKLGVEKKIREKLEKYQFHNQAHFSFRIVDPLKELDLVSCFNVKASSGAAVRTPLIVSQGKCVEDKKNKSWKFVGTKIALSKFDEQELTNKVHKVTQAKSKEICFLTGRGQGRIKEKNPRTGLSNLNTMLKDKNYETREVDLFSEDQVPASCSVLINVSPEYLTVKDPAVHQGAKFGEKEVEAIETFLKKGGKLLAFQEPIVQTGLESLLEKYGLKMRDGMVIDFYKNFGKNLMVPVTNNLSNHEITKELKGEGRVFFQTATAIQISRKLNVTTQSIVSTSPSQFMGMPKTLKCCSFLVPEPHKPAFMKLLTLPRIWTPQVLLNNVMRGYVQQQVKGAVVGTFVIAAVAVKKNKKAEETRVVVIGDALLASNSLFRGRGNQSLVMNSINWLADEKDLISIAAKKIRPSRIFLSGKQKSLVGLTTKYAMPLFFLFLLLLVWAIRTQK